MILRINQFDPQAGPSNQDWPEDGFAGDVQCRWPPNTRGFELLLLETDETQQPTRPTDRQAQMRRLLPRLIESLRGSEDWIVFRFDGPMLAWELARAVALAIDPLMCERYAFSGADRLDPAFEPPTGSVRLVPAAGRLQDILTDEQLGLPRQVRLRVFALPEELVNPFLDTASTEDERWREILPASGFCLSTGKQLQRMQIFTNRFDAETIRQKVSQLATSLR